MTFYGNYIRKVNDGTIKLKCDLNGELYNVICAQENEAITFIALCKPDSAFEKEVFEYAKVLSSEVCKIHDKVTLPDDFIKYLNGKDVKVLGCGNRIEMYKEDVCLTPLSEGEVQNLLDKLIDKFEK